VEGDDGGGAGRVLGHQQGVHALADPRDAQGEARGSLLLLVAHARRAGAGRPADQRGVPAEVGLSLPGGVGLVTWKLDYWRVK
jgi:hypothetical protein